MVEISVWGNELKLQTHDSLFSPRHADRGTLHMLSTVNLKEGDKVLDLGCGYGLVGIAAAKIVGEGNVDMVDINPRACELARANANANGVPGVNIICADGIESLQQGTYDYILCNPPYHVDFSVPKRFIHVGCGKLKRGGSMVFVVKRLLWYKNKFISIFGGVKIGRFDDYYVLLGVKGGIDKQMQQI